MRLSGPGWLGLEVGIVLSALAATGSLADAQVASARSSSNSGTETTAISYTAVLRDQQQPQNPNAPNQPAPPAPQQPAPTRKPKYDIYIGPDAGVYLPTSAKTRGRFGSEWSSFGVGIFPVSTPSSRGHFSASLDALSQSNGNDYAYFGLFGVQYRQAILPHLSEKPTTEPPKPQPGNQPQPGNPPKPAPERKPNYIPYYGFSAYEAIGDLRAVEDNVHSGIRTGVAGAAFFGVQYRDRAYIEAKYLQTSVLKSFDLSGFTLNIGYRFKIVGY